MTWEKPKQRKGHILSAVWWDAQGRVRFTKYEPIRKSIEVEPDIGDIGPVARQVIERVERGVKVEQTDLFGS